MNNECSLRREVSTTRMADPKNMENWPIGRGPTEALRQLPRNPRISRMKRCGAASGAAVRPGPNPAPDRRRGGGPPNGACGPRRRGGAVVRPNGTTGRWRESCHAVRRPASLPRGGPRARRPLGAPRCPASRSPDHGPWISPVPPPRDTRDRKTGGREPEHRQHPRWSPWSATRRPSLALGNSAVRERASHPRFRPGSADNRPFISATRREAIPQSVCGRRGALVWPRPRSPARPRRRRWQPRTPAGCSSRARHESPPRSRSTGRGRG
jgi:hypothetical protein